jgi:hypothetical protein
MTSFSGLHLTAIMAVLVAGVWFMRRQHGIAVSVLNKRQVEMLSDFELYL